MGSRDTPQLDVREHQQQRHAHEHYGALQGLGVHHGDDAARDHVGGYYDGEYQQRHVIVQVKGDLYEACGTDEDDARIQGHEQENQYTREALYEAGVEPLSHELWKRDSAEVLTHLSRTGAKQHECDEDTNEDVEKGEPEQSHSEQPSHTSKAHDCGSRDERGAIGDRHHKGMSLPSRHHEVLDLTGALIPIPAQIKHCHEVHEHRYGECERGDHVSASAN